MPDLSDRRIVLGVSGSIAAFKAAALASDLTKAGATVRTILTSGARQFISDETFRGLTGQPVATSLWRAQDDESLDHIEMAEWGELLVVAPASANVIGHLALGLADDLLSTVALAFDGSIVVVPAMESHMYRHPATQANIKTLRDRGAIMVGPAAGRLASGTFGEGRMVEPEAIVAAISELLATEEGAGKRDLNGVQVLITAGPTREPLDPVRFISNRSSGKMGYALAAATRRRGAAVTLVSGPVDASLIESLPSGVRLLEVEGAEEMRSCIVDHVKAIDVLLMAAAVADFQPASRSAKKIKKSAGTPTIQLEPTPDILADLNEAAPAHLIRVGFAAETEDLIRNAEAKLKQKGLAMVVANDVGGRDGAVFSSDTNTVVILRPDREPELLPKMPKQQLAHLIIDRVVDVLRKNRPNAAVNKPDKAVVPRD